MKLLSKTSLLIITVSIFIFLAGDIIFFYVSKSMINDYLQKELNYQMYEVLKQIEEKGINFNTESFNSDISIKEIDNHNFANPVIFDTVLYNRVQRKFIPHKSLKLSYAYHDKLYLISIYKSMLSSNKLIERITVASIFLVLSFLFVIYTLNRFVFVNVWSNFFENINKIRKYNINSREKLDLEAAEIDEFKILNTVLQQMVEKIQKDFTVLKELTENTSHEIQTPLAIIKSKAEILLQSETLSEKDIESVSSILNTCNRLSKLNRSLLMVSKIENNQFADTKRISLNETLDKYIHNFDMLLQSGNFNLDTEPFELEVNINPVLLDVLISNLLKNAIVHNNKKRNIFIRLDETMLTISNTGISAELNSSELYQRFIKGSDDIKRSGLGLEIVKKVCDYYDLVIHYQFADGLHIFSIDFSSVIFPETPLK